jgi:tetratricopeptide (TPR) repeat protein
LDRPAPILGVGTEWKYSPGAPEVAEGTEDLDWTHPAFDDSHWLSGPAGFGYGPLSPELGTTVSTMQGTHTSLYVRGRFSLPSSREPRVLLLRVRFDDGFVAYLNGEDIARHNAGRHGEVLSHDRTASHGVGGLPVELSIPLPERLVRRGGVNVLALRVLNQDVDSSDLLLDPEVLGLGEPEVDPDDRLYADLRAALKESPPLLAYLEGRILQRAGRQEDALEAYRRVLELNHLRGEPTLRIVEVLEAREDFSGAQAAVHRALEEGREPRDVLWDAWSHLAFVRLRWSIEEALRHLPKAPPRPGIAYGAQLRWLLETLGESGTLRINCGGPDYQGPDERRWASDRYYLGGGFYGAARSVPGEIEGTRDDPLFQTERYWRAGERRTDEAYRIPLPLGEYSVALHVAEVYWSTADSRVFDVVLEGKLRTTDYDIVLERGRSGVADAMTFTVAVGDGALDIALPARKDNPKLSALEVSRSGRDRVSD